MYLLPGQDEIWWPTCAKAELSETKVHTAKILWFVVGVLIHAAFMNMLYLSIGSICGDHPTGEEEVGPGPTERTLSVL